MRQGFSRGAAAPPVRLFALQKETRKLRAGPADHSRWIAALSGLRGTTHIEDSAVSATM
jgi:hypothetical protein